MNHRNAQVTTFLIVCLLILSIAIIYVQENSLKNPNVESPQAPSEITPIKIFIESCIEKTSKDAVILVGKQGGFYKLPEFSLSDENFNVPFYNKDVPSIETIENELSDYIEDNLNYCIDNFSEFKELGYMFNTKKTSVQTKINQNRIDFFIALPTEIWKGDAKFTITDFIWTLENFPLKKIHNTSISIVQKQIEVPHRICISCLANLANKRNLKIDFTEYFSNTLIFDIRNFNTSSIGIYNYSFALKYDKFSCENLGAVDDFLFTKSCLENEKSRLLE